MDDINPNAPISHDAIGSYLHYFDHVCADLPVYGVATYHLLVGSMPHIRRLRIPDQRDTHIDPRAHVLIIGPTSTGKGQAFKFASSLARENLGLSFRSVGGITENTWLGTYAQSEIYDKTTKSRTKVFKPVHGILSPQCPQKGAPYDIIGAEEAAVVFHVALSQRASILHEILTKTMNPLGSADNLVNKDTALALESEPIEFYPECSLLLTTVPPRNLTDVIVSQGFAQRFLLVLDPRTEAEQTETSLKVAQRRGQHVDIGVTRQHIASHIRRADAFASGIESMVISPESAYTQYTILQRLQEQTGQADAFHQHHIRSFLNRQLINIVKMASHYALLEESDTIHPAHLELAYDQYQPIFQSLRAFIETTIQPPKQDLYYDKMKDLITRIYMTLRKSNGNDPLVPRGRITATLMKAAKVTPITATKWIDRMIAQGDLIPYEKQVQNPIKEESQFVHLPGIDPHDDLGVGNSVAHST